MTAWGVGQVFDLTSGGTNDQVGDLTYGERLPDGYAKVVTFLWLG